MKEMPGNSQKETKYIFSLMSSIKLFITLTFSIVVQIFCIILKLVKNSKGSSMIEASPETA